jgi:ribosomal-protein-alanine N-acetyltransferase
MEIEFANDRYLSWLNDPEVNKYLEVPKQNNLADLKKYVQGTIDSNVLFWAIVKKDDGKHIGNIKIDPINTKHGYGEYGILMGDRNEWGKGFAKEASKAIVDFCFNSLNLRKVNLGVVAANKAAVHMYAKLNFVTEGVYRHHVKLENEYCDVIRMAIFNEKIIYK